MDSERLQKIKNICFSNEVKQYRKNMMASKSRERQAQYKSVTSPLKNQEDKSIERMKERSKSRQQKIEERMSLSLNHSANTIKRQPTQSLQSMGAYRQMRKDTGGLDYSRVQSPSFQDLNVTPDPYRFDQSSIAEGASHEKSSYIQKLRKKSEERSRSKSGAREGTYQRKGGTIAERLHQISKSRSRSRSAAKAGGPSPVGGRRGGQTAQNQFKQIEDSVVSTVENKSNALKKNLQVMKERMSMRQQAKEAQIQSESIQQAQNYSAGSDGAASGSNIPPGSLNIINSVDITGYRNRTLSPFYAQNNFGSNAFSSNGRRASFSPPSFRNQRHSRHSFGRTPHQQRMMGESLDQSSIDRGHVGLSPFPAANHLAMLQTLMPNQEVDTATKMQHAKNIISYILNMISQLQQGFSQNIDKNEAERNLHVLPPASIAELQLKLEGAYERLDQIQSDDHFKSESLLAILQNFLNDIFLKIQGNFQPHEYQIQPQTQLLQSILMQLADQLTQYEFHEALPHIARALHDLRISLGVQKLHSIHVSGTNGSAALFINHLKQDGQKRRRGDKILKKVLMRYVRKAESLSMKSHFDYWNQIFQKRNRNFLKEIVPALNQFGAAIVEQAPKVNYATFKGLPEFAYLVSELLRDVLGLSQGVFIDILYLNKSGTLACGFLTMPDGTVLKEEYDISSRNSILNQALRNDFIPGKILAPSKFQNISSLRNFDSNSDLPLCVDRHSLMQDPRGLHQLIHPIMTKNLKQVKMAIRLTTTQRDEILSPNQLQFIKFGIEEVQAAVVSGLGQFKALSKQFCEFQQRIDRNADSTFISERTLQQLQLLNEASLELSEDLDVSQVFELINKTFTGLLDQAQYERCFVVQISDGYVLRMVDNTKKQRRNNRGQHALHGFSPSEEDLEQIGYLDEPNPAVREKIIEMGSLCLEGACPPWIQILLEQADSLEISGKAVRDIVLIPITQIYEKGQHDHSRTNTDAGITSGTQDNLHSYAWDSSVAGQSTSALKGPNTSTLGSDIYLLKLEKKLAYSQQQMPFDQQIDTNSILQTLRKFIQICLTKLKLLNRAVKGKLALERTISDQEESFLKLTQQNQCLKKQIRVQKAISNALEELKQGDGSDSSRHYEVFSKRIESVIQDFVPNAKMMQLFLSKDEEGRVLYTYSQAKTQINYAFQTENLGQGEHISSFASLIRAQSTTGQGNGLGFGGQHGLISDWATGEGQMKAPGENPYHQNTAGFKNPNRLATITSHNRDSEQDVPEGQNWNRQGLPSHIDDISSIDAGNEFTNFENRQAQINTLIGLQASQQQWAQNQPKHQNLIHVDEEGHDLSQFSPKDKIDINGQNMNLQRCSSQKNTFSRFKRDIGERQQMQEEGPYEGQTNRQDPNHITLSQDFVAGDTQNYEEPGAQGKSLRKYKSARGDLDMVGGPKFQAYAGRAQNLDQPEEYFQAVADGTIGQGLLTSVEETLQINNFPLGPNGLPLIQTGGFNAIHKNATQQVSAKSKEAKLMKFGGTAVCSESAASIETHNLACGKNGLQGFSSYGELLHDIVEDEFDMTTSDPNLHKIIVKPLDLALKGHQNSLLFQSIFNSEAQSDKSNVQFRIQTKPVIFSRVSQDPSYSSQIDGIIKGSNQTNQNPLKRQKSVENTAYIPIIHQSNQVLHGVIQVANMDKNEVFSSEDAEILYIIALGIAQFLNHEKQAFLDRINVQRKLDSTILSTQMEGNQLNQVLLFSNKLFQDQTNPLKALHKFLIDSEKYLRAQFQCEAAQILLIDQKSGEFLSAGSVSGKGQLVGRGSTAIQSVASHIVTKESLYCYPPTRTSYQNSSMFPRESTNSLNASHQQQIWHLSFLFNQDVDLPLNWQLDGQHQQFIPNTFLAQLIQGPQNDYHAVIQLIQKTDSQRFSDQDVMNLNLVSEQLGQVLSQVQNSGFLSSVSFSHFQGVHKLAEVLTSKYKQHVKHFFFELVAIRHGKNVVLKNKILRKQLNQRMEIDQEFVKKTEKLMALAEKFSRKTKKATINRLNRKLQQISAARRQNAEKCLATIQKYQKLLSIRVKDTVFQQWLHKLRMQKVILNNPRDNLNKSVSIRNSQIRFTENEFGLDNESHLLESLWHGDQTSIVSSHFLKAKKIYNLKKIFNRSKLRVLFDVFVIKTLQGHKRGYRLLGSSGQKRQLANLMMHKILVTRIIRKQRQAFNQFWKVSQERKRAFYKLRRAVQNKHRKILSAGFQNWRYAFSQSFRFQALQNSQQLIKAKEKNAYDGLFALITRQIDQVFNPTSSGGVDYDHGHYRTAEECLRGNNFRNMMYDVLKYLLETSRSYPFRENGNQVQEVVLNLALPPSHDLDDGSPGYNFAQISFVPTRKLLKFEDFSQLERPSFKPSSSKEDSMTFVSISDLLQNKCNEYRSNTLSALEQAQAEAKRREFEIRNKIENRYEYNFEFASSESDELIKAVEQTNMAFKLRRAEEDQNLKASFAKRRIESAIAGQPRDLLVVPVRDDLGQLSGSLEVYVDCDEGEKGDKKLKDDDMYWLEVFQGYSESIGSGMKKFMSTMLRQLAVQADLIKTELNFEFNTFAPVQLQSLLRGDGSTAVYDQSPIKFTKLVYEIDLMLRKAFRADVARVIFLPSKDGDKGIFMDGPFNNREMFSVDLQGTVARQIIKSSGCTQITMPSSLVSRQPFKSISIVDPQFTIKGEQFEAVKYLAVRKNQTQLFAVIEVAWTSLQQACFVHENPLYMSKKEEKMVAVTKETINQTYIKLKLMTGGIKQKNSYEVLRLKVRGFFRKWKRYTFLEQFTNCFGEKGMRQQDLSNTTMMGRGHLDLSQDSAPQYCPILPNYDTSKDLSMAMSRKGPSRMLQASANSPLAGYSSSFPTQKANLAPLKLQQQFDQMMASATHDQLKANQLAKALKVLSFLASRKVKRSNLETYFTQWQMFMRNARLAESAFEQILKMHKKHSKQRFASAVSFLSRLDRRISYKCALEAIIEQAIDEMQEEASQQHKQKKIKQIMEQDAYIQEKYGGNQN